MTVKCPLCQLNYLKDTEYLDYDALTEHCEDYHTIKTLAASFVEGYYTHKHLVEAIRKKMNDLQNTGLTQQFQVASYNTLKSLLEGLGYGV